MGKRKNKFLSLLLVFFFMLSYIILPSMPVYAEDTGSEATEVKVLEEGFKGTVKETTPVGDGWIITHNGEAVPKLEGYDTNGNFGRKAPSLSFGKIKPTTSDILESPSFELKGEGTLSFWYKGQGQGITSTIKVECLTTSGWSELPAPDLTKTTAQTYSAAIPKDATKIKLSYTKASGNASIDDIVVSYIENGGGTDPEPEVNIIKISAARALNKGEEAVVRGTVSFNDGSKTVHIEDETGGIAIYNSSALLTNLAIGDYVEVKGKIDIYNGLCEIIPSSVDTDIKIIEKNKTLVPKQVTIEELLKGGYDSQYVEIKNTVLDTTEKTLTQGTEVLNIYKIPTGLTVQTGDIVDVKGTMGIYIDPKTGIETIQIYGSSCAFTKVAAPDVEAPVIKHEAVTKAYIGENLIISATVTDEVKVEKVTLSYKVIGKDNLKAVEMVKGEGDIYSAVIPKEELDLAGIEYSFEATDGTNLVKYPVEGLLTIEITGEDIIGPEIYDLVPINGASVGEDRRPVISALFRDDAGINKDTIKMFVDDIEVTAKATVEAEAVTYRPEIDLSDGNHTIKVEVQDLLGNKATLEWSFRVGALNHYFGQLHAHTNISDGAGTLDAAYQWVKKAGADYYAVTDHSNWFDNDTKGSIADGSVSTAWTKAHATADKYNDEGVFTAIYGYEMTWSGSTGGWGHMNTFNTPGFETRANSTMNLENYYKTLQTQPQSLSQFNHPGKTFGDFGDFGYYSEATDQVVNLVEVGNGEGPIRGSGYFPSYEYYTRALDKGWHVAPTNNQDNHKGNWYTSNDARTVIIASDNTREDLYQGIREKSVYASEDKNMTIDYTVNGQIMGTSLSSNVDKLKFKINVNDDDPVSKISVIANGGVEVISKNFNDSEVNWNFELEPDYTYYYVKVVQCDQDIAVTAPIWVGESLNAGLTNITTESTLAVPGDKVNFAVGVYNNGLSALENVKIEFFENQILEENKFAEKTILNVPVTSTENINVEWSPKSKGDYTILAKATVLINGVETIFTAKKEMKVEDPTLVQKVVIDGAHQNQYVSGNYAGKYTALKALLEARKTQLVINKNLITDTTFEGVDLFILSCPQSVDDSKYNLTKSKLEPSEIEAIKRFVDNGGDIIVTTVADYKDGVGEYSKNNQLNPLLEAIGTQLRVNDDEVIDKTTNGGQDYRLYLTRYSEANLYGLVDGIEAGVEKYSFYSGASVILADGATGEKVDFLVKGYETTTTLDADNAKDNVSVEMGKVNVIGAEELENGAKVVVAGNTFFSDFETDGTNATTYSNIKVLTNILNWSVAEKSAPVTSIAALRLDENNDNIPDLLGEEFTVEGIVTSQSEAVQPKNAFFEVVYIEDETGGICVFGISNTELRLGQKVRVTGKVDCYQGEFEIQISDEDSQVIILGETQRELSPIELLTGDSMLKANGGRLITVQGKVTRMDGSNIYIDDGSGEARVYVEGYIWDGVNEDLKGKWNPEIKMGDTVSAVGLGSYDPEGARLRVRNTGEIILLQSGEIPEETNEKPIITGADALTIMLGEEFNPMNGVKAIDKEDGDLTSKIIVTGEVDTTKVGTYVLIYQVTDSDGNKVTKERKIVVIAEDIPEESNESPIITGVENLTIKLGDKFDSLSGVKATDKEDGELTSKIIVTGEVNTTEVGEYVITYSVTDSDGNTVKVERKITVKVIEVPEESNEKPVITGVDELTIKVGDKFDSLAGVKVMDKEDGEITSKLIVTGKVDTTKVGEYILTYSITDSNKNTVTIERKIRVESKNTDTEENKDEDKDKLPQTGGKNSNLIVGAIAVITIVGGTIILIRKKKEEKTGN